MRVAPNGDDAGALADDNATPFASVQAAIDFAADHASGPSRVCVAGGNTCQESATYEGPLVSDLTMRDGIDLLGSYESTSWARCPVANTTLAPQTPLGVVFPPAVTSPTTLDGFTIVGSTLGTSMTAVTVDGAANVVLSNLVVAKNAPIPKAYGIVLQNGADAIVSHSRIEVADGYDEMVGIKSVGSRLQLVDSSGADNPGDPTVCLTTGNGVVVSTERLSRNNRLEQRGILLESSPGSIIADSDVCDSLSGAGTTTEGRAALVEIYGDATGTVLRRNRFTANPHEHSGYSTLAMTDCAGAAPWITGNTIKVVDGAYPTHPPEAIYAGGDCHPFIDSNPAITVTARARATAVRCGTENGVDSRCIVSNNPNIGVYFPYLVDSGAQEAGTGIQCDGASCARIDHNYIAGVAQSPTSTSCSVFVSGVGLLMNESSALVSANLIIGNAGPSRNSVGIGLSGSGALRIENNFIYGSYSGVGPSPFTCPTIMTTFGLVVSGAADVSSNYISTGFADCWVDSPPGPLPEARLAYAVSAGPGGTFRNNVMVGCASFRESDASSDPLVFENNDLPNGYLDEGATYPNADFSDPRITATEVNALSDMTVGGNLAATCFTSNHGVMHLAADSACIDTGSSTGAPSVDYDGQERDVTPDIGPDEYVP